MKEIGLPLLLLTALASPAFAADCQPNGIGGSFALTMTVRLPTRCLTKSTAWIRTRIMAAIPVPCPIGQGRMKALEGSSLSTQQGVGSGQSDSALAGRDWHSPANLNDGAATSSMSLLDKP